MDAETVAEAEAAHAAVDPTMITAQEAMSLQMALDDRVAMILAATAYDRGMAAIMAATTPAEARAAYAAIDQSAISGQQAMTLQALVNSRVDELETAAREMMQKQALMDAADMLDTSDLSDQEAVNTARAAIVELRNALDNAADVSEADKMPYMSMLTDAEMAVKGAQDGIDLATARMDQMDALSSASMDLQAALAALSGTTPTQDLLDAANNALTALNAAITGGTDLSDAEKATYVREAAHAVAPIQTAQTALDKINQDEQDAMDAAARAVVTKAAETKLDAINAEAALAVDADSGLGGTVAPATGAGAYNLTVERNRMDTMVTVSVQDGATADADEDEAFEQAMDFGDGLTMHTREGEDGMEEIAMVMTDIEAPKAVKFADFEAEDGTNPQALDVRADGTTADDDNPNDSRDLGSALVSTTPADADVLKLIEANAFSAPGSGATTVQHTFLAAADDGDPNTPGNQPRAAAMVAGTYNGADGTYTCTGTANCTVSVNAMGMLTAASDGWIFTPAKDATSDQPDYDYLNYGFWLKKTTDEDGVVTYNEVAPFHMAVSMAASAGAVTGSASYEGSAVGVYVHNILSEGGGMVDSRTAGHFTADASLKAYFAQPTEVADQNIPPNMLNTITGMINNFALSGDEAQDWSVALKGTVDLTGANDDFNGTANGGGAEGMVSGNFYGAEAMLPDAATGEFNANFSNGHVSGAFGVNKD